MRHVTGLLAKMFHRQCLNHLWIREQQEGMIVPLNPHMMYVVMGCEEVRDLHTRGGVSILFVA